MKINNREEIEKLLKEYNEFSECIIERFTLKDYGTTLEVCLDYIWTEENEIRPDLDTPKVICLSFRLVQELHIVNALNSTMCKHPEELNWGVNEISRVKVAAEGEISGRYGSLPIPFHQVSFLWEGERRMDIVFSELQISSE